MTAKELLIPRYEVINSYPQPLEGDEVGAIITLDRLTDDGRAFVVRDRLSCFEPYFECYPHIFRRVNWWEHRTEEQMPKRLKSLATKDVYEIDRWDMENLVGYIAGTTHSACDLTLFKPEYGYVPMD